MRASKASCGDAFSWHAARLAPLYTRRADPPRSGGRRRADQLHGGSAGETV